MTSNLLQPAPHEAENQLEISLRQAFQLVQPQLKPPFPLTIPSSSHYSHLNQAILYALLTQPHSTKTHITHLHAIVTDAYQLFVKMLIQLGFDLYPKLLPSVKAQLICITREMVRVEAVGIQTLLLSLLRQITGGDLSDPNLWLCMELLTIVFDNWDWVLQDPFLLTTLLFTYLRLLADHSRMIGGAPKYEDLKCMEIDFCLRVLRNHFDLCMRIGRDLVRLLQDLLHLPQFLALWKDLLLNPAEFKVPDFSDISQLYCSRTSNRYHLLRITPDMENHLRFLLTHVKFGCQRRYQAWFAKKFLHTPHNETVICDIVRFICCAHHPSNHIIHSNVISRWAVIGWLLKSCRNYHVQANAKLALFYDWIFYNDKVDNIMNIEPAMLLMVNSIPKYVDMTHSLLEFLFQLLDNYDVQRKDFIVRGVSTAFTLLVTKGVVPSLQVLTSSTLLSSFLRERLANTFLKPVSKDSGEASTLHLPHRPMPPMSLSTPSDLVCSTSFSMEQNTECVEENGHGRIPALENPVADCNSQLIPSKSPTDVIDDLVQRLRGAIKQSNKFSVQVLEEILFFYAIHGCHAVGDTIAGDSILHPQVLACQITEAFKLSGYNMFSPLNFDIDDEIHSASSLVICTFIFCQHKRMQEMIMFWSKNGYLIGPRFLSYASRLAYEAHKMSCLVTPLQEKNSTGISYSDMPLLKNHIDRYVSYMTARENASPDVVYSVPMRDDKLLMQLVEAAFGSYKIFLMLCNISQKEKDLSAAMLLFSDVLCCCGWEITKLKSLFYNVFCYLPDLTSGKEDCIRLLVHKLDHLDLVALQFEICLGRFSMFGEDIEIISHLVQSSLNWGALEQEKFWGLMASELAVSKIRVDKLVTDIFYLGVVDPNPHSIAVGGLFTLCTRRAPSTELVSMIFSLPNNVFGGFAASVLANWVVCNGSMLFNSLAKCLEKFDKNQDTALSNYGAGINYSSISRFLDFLDKQAWEQIQCTTEQSISIPEIKAKLADVAAVQKSR